MLSKRKILSGDILQGTASGAGNPFRKSAEKWDGDLEGGEGFPGGRKIGVKRRDGRGGEGAFNGEFLEMSCGDDGSG